MFGPLRWRVLPTESEITLTETADEAIEENGHVEHTVLYGRRRAAVPWDDDRDEWWGDAVESRNDDSDTVALASDDPLIILYTSRTTGKPKGTVQTHAGQLMPSANEVYFGLDHKPLDRFFWVSDIGWVMGP